ncbi:uncharacterized protein M421DRAFT_421179 [Didymella exigua CBS 183.55]|uniref:Uncharacterized protein n=1 Tax=Didymella exigua CBS 183.55 TaxID=1150837 RepID=A0A6A5RI15_9PLEO|nr:uncharacterized protein M421DRAFT_421179 [Didymella exigua CBS 183.55]KAF1927975.1 hypothetical protein M421DRAFT_421179 [Didymella exigua CBS 183.55]
MPLILVEALERVGEQCIPLLDELAGCKQPNEYVDPWLSTDFQHSAGLLEDWNTLMADAFNLGTRVSFDFS